MAGTQPESDGAVDNVDDVSASAAVSTGGKLKRKHEPEPHSDADDSRPRAKERNSGADVPEGKTTVATEEYTVGWVCALPLEMAAAKGMLDKVHPNLPEQDAADHNSYVLGEVQGHNVVIACLPAGIYGTTPAATVAKDLLRTFKSIRFGLMVGIGGGAPSQAHDIRLGDIVVSQPTGTSGGVVQYDRGKTVQQGEFQRTGSLNAPPQVLLAALGRLQADHLIEDSRIPEFLQDLVRKSPKRMKKKFGYQGATNDHLFHAGYDHVNRDATCERCDRSQTVERDARDDEDPVIHYGTIASGNQVIKDGRTRDRLGGELGVLCFEMEAAGLQDFPCLVIRGICDYADSHKNKAWQEYAAATAAAFAKELLSVIPPTRVMQEKPIPHLVSDPRLHELVSHTNMAISAQTQKQEVRYENQKQVDCHWAFKTSTYEKFKNINPERVPGTCKWVLEHPRYTQWQQSHHDGLLWISADPGCGKSVLAKSLIDEELQHTDEHTVCYFFFKDNNEQNSLSTALCALLHQLFHHQTPLLSHAMPAFEKDGQKIQMEVDELWRIFLAAGTDDQAVNITCVIDALDECSVDDRQKFIRFLTSFHSQRASSTRKSQLKFLVTSRPYQDIESEFRDIPEPQSIRLAGEDSNANISDEINLVIQDKVATAGRKLGMSQDVQDALQKKLSSVPHRTYLWLHLVIDEVYHNPKRHKKTFIKELDSLPTTVEDAYEKILGRLTHNRRHEAQTLLHIVVGARRPLTVAEMDVAFQLATDAPDAQAHEDLDLDHDHLKSQIRELCGLFVFINDSRIYLIHQTAKEFLVTQKSPAGPAGNLWKHSLYEPQSNAVMGKVCVQYLSFRDIRDDQFKAFTGNSNIDSVRYPFLDYSATYWPAHSRHAPSTNEGLQERILKLYDIQNQRFGTWLSIFWKTNYRLRPRDGISNAHLAALNGHHEVLQRLLAMDRSALNSKDGEGRTPLIWGCLEGHGKIVQMLLDHGADVNARGGEYGNALQTASFKGYDKIVRILLDSGADIDASGGKHSSALQAASSGGHDTIVQMLVDKGADANAPGGSVWCSALQATSSGGYDKVIRILLGKGADVNRQGGEYGNALQAAASQGHAKTTQLLLDGGADVDAPGGVYHTALQAASSGGHDEIVQMLLDKGADVNARRGGVYGTALQAASFRGHDKIAQMLLGKGADANAQGGDYGNALQAASSGGHSKIVQMLVDKGAEVNMRGGFYGQALQAASAVGRGDIVQILLKNGADVNARGGRYSNALQAASSKGHVKAAQMLLGQGADANMEGGDYGNALQAASSKGHGEIVRMLLDSGADANAQGGFYRNALRAASKEGHTEIVRMLLDSGADANARGSLYGNALHGASAGGHEKIVQMLLDKGADVNAFGSIYGNARRAASANGHKKIVQMLLDHGADGGHEGHSGAQPLEVQQPGGGDGLGQEAPC